MRLGPVEIDELNGGYRDLSAKIAASLSGATVRTRFPRIDSVVVNLGIPQVSFESAWWSGPIDTLGIAGAVDSSGVLVDEFLVAAQRSRVTLAGTIPFKPTKKWDVETSVHLDVGALAFLRERVPQLAQTGYLDVTGTMGGTLAQPELRAAVEAADMGYAGYELDSLLMTALYGTDEIARLKGMLRSPFGELALDVGAAIPGLFSSPRVEKYTLDADIDELRLAKIEQLANLEQILHEPLAQLSMHISGVGVGDLPEHAGVEATITASELREEPVRIEAALDSMRWRLDAGWRRNTLDGEGILGSDGDMAGTVRVSVREPGVIARTFADMDAGGELYAWVDLGGNIGRPRVEARAVSPDLRWRGIIADTLNASVAWDNDTLRLGDTYAVVGGSLARILEPFGIEEVAGDAQVTITSASGTLDNPRVEGMVGGTEISFGEFGVDRISARVILESRDSISWRDLIVRRGEAAVSGRGTLSLDEVRQIQAVVGLLGLGAEKTRPAGDLLLAGAIEPDSIDITFRASELDLRVIGALAPIEEDLSGRLTAGGTIAGINRRLKGSIDFSLDRPAARGIELLAVDGGISLVDSFARANATVRLRNTDKTIDIQARAPVSTGEEFALAADGGRPFYVWAEGDSIPLAGFNDILGDRLSLSGGPATIDVAMQRADNGWVLDGSVVIEKGSIAYNPLELAMEAVSFRAGLGGLLSMPRISFEATTGDVRLPSFRVANSRWEGTLRGDTITLTTGFADVEPGGSIRITGSVPISDVKKIFAGGDPELEFELTEVPITILEQFVPGLDVKRGILEGEGRIVLKNGELTTRGALNLRDAVFDLAGIETLIGPVSGKVDLAGDTLVIRDLNGRLGEGTFGADGVLALGPAGTPVMNVRLEVDGTSIELTDLATVRIMSADLQLAPRPEGHILRGEINLAQTRITRDFTIPELVELAGRQGTPDREPSEFMQNLELKIFVDLQRNLFFDSNLGRGQLGGRIALSGTAVEPGITGEIVVVEGTVYYLDRPFEIVDGAVRFLDPLELNPVFDIRATTEVTATTPSAIGDIPDLQAYEITLLVTGTLENPEVVLTSDPPLTQPDIVSVLTLGTPLGAVGGNLAERIRGLAANQLLGFGARKLGQLLGLDDVTVTGGFAGQAGADTDPRITLTKRITKRLTLTYGTELTTLENQEVMAVYRIFRWLYLVGVNDQTNDSYAGIRVRLRW
ncbi:MAG: hypothetical protein GF344_14595 [Chitinivibrionales bacterium]|nr:hypothetical protein [Chitinivibrionales bacterium]MBD3357949.1 hypothetical protein [Chitinivibrionales bacterium]